MILLDTNVISQPMRDDAPASVLKWLDVHFSQCALSSITVMELSIGLAGLPLSKRRTSLEAILTRTVRRFGPRLFGFDLSAANAAAIIYKEARAKGLPIHQRGKIIDLQLAAIASAYGLTIATRDIADFDGLGIDLINPWEAT